MLYIWLNRDISFGHWISRIYSFQETEHTVFHDRPNFRALLSTQISEMLHEHTCISDSQSP